MYCSEKPDINRNSESNHASLHKKALRGGAWVFAEKGIEQIFNIGRLLILARLLSPQDFGVIGIAFMLLNILGRLSQIGFQHALIQKKGRIEHYLDSAWTILIIRGFIVCAILYIFAPMFAGFFNETRAKPVIQVMGIGFLLGSVKNIGVVFFKRDLQFHKQFIFRFSGLVTDFMVALILAIIFRNVWALVFGFIAGNLVMSIISYYLNDYRPCPTMNLSKGKDLFLFGRWILLTQVFDFLIIRGDHVFVGKVLGATALGFYLMAYRLSTLPATEIYNIISQVLFPTYSKLQDDIPRLGEAFLKVIKISAFFVFPMSALIFILSPDFVRLILKEKWMPMVPAMQILVFWGLFRALSPGPIFQSVGKPAIHTWIQILRVLALSILIYPLSIKYGIRGTAWAVFIQALVTYPISMFLAFRILRFRVGEFVKIMIIPLIGSGLLTAGVYGLENYAFRSVNLPSLIFLAIIGVFIYSAFTMVLAKKFNYDIISMLKRQYRAFL
mgnify:CR=1 FL=1